MSGLEVSEAAGARTETATRARRGGTVRLILGIVALFVVLTLARVYTYQLFHSLAELFSVCVALAVAAIAWNTRRIANNPFLLFLGAALAAVAVTDVLHTLSYKGMGVFLGDDVDLPTQLWLVGRYLFTLAFLVAPFLINGGMRRVRVALGGLATVWVLLLFSVFVWGNFPVALVEGQGLTAFKVGSEYVVAALLLVALALLLLNRAAFERRILGFLSGAILVTIASELSFTLYVDPFGVLNLVGHYLKIIAFFLLYLAIVDRTLVAPYSLLFRGLREREARLEGIGQVSEAAMQSLELHQLMDSVLARIVDLMGAQAALIMLMRGGRLVTVASRGFREGLADDFTLGFGEGIAGHVAETRKSVCLPDVDTEPRAIHSILEKNAIRSMAAVPLLRGDELLGVLHVDWQEQREIPPDELRYIELLADRVAVAVFNADLYRRQKEVAEALQREMLVLPSELPGIRFGHAYHSASEGAHVGGDFYDLFPDGSSRAWMVMGDVSGHGIEAATAGSMIREITRAFALEVGRPAEVMQMVNRSVVQRLNFRHYATMFVGALDLNSGTLTYCSAGHPPGFIVRGDQTVTELASRSLPVGAFADAAYGSADVDMAPDDSLFLYTDGITEARRGGSFFGEEGLLEVFKCGHPPELLPRLVLAAAEEFCEGHLIDDLAALCVAAEAHS